MKHARILLDTDPKQSRPYLVCLQGTDRRRSAKTFTVLDQCISQADAEAVAERLKAPEYPDDQRQQEV